MQKIQLLGLLIAAISMTLLACQPEMIVPEGQSVSVRNTLQIEADTSQGGTGGAEVPVEAVFGAPDGLYEISSTVSEGIEFEGYLEGLYDIDFSENAVSFRLVAEANHPIYQNFFRVIEANTFDRYYFSFGEGHDIQSATSSDPAASLRILSEQEIVIEIGEGWNFNPGSSFTLTFN